LECDECQHRFTNPNSESHVTEVYGDDYFFGGNAGYQDYLSEEALLIRHAQQYVDLIAKHREPGISLDVGAAAGFSMRAFSQADWETHGIDPNPTMVKHNRDKFGHSASVATLEDFQTDRHFDLITMIQVIAHFHDLAAAMDRAAAMTRPNGYWLIESWNYRSLTARMFGKHWHEYSPPSVLHWFSLNSILRLADQRGMQLVAKGQPKKRINGEHAKSLLQYRLQQSKVGKLLAPATGLIPNRVSIPYPSEDLFWVLLQKK